MPTINWTRALTIAEHDEAVATLTKVVIEHMLDNKATLDRAIHLETANLDPTMVWEVRNRAYYLIRSVTE